MTIFDLDYLKKGDRVSCGGYGSGSVTSKRYNIVYVLFDGSKKPEGIHYHALNLSFNKDGVK